MRRVKPDPELVISHLRAGRSIEDISTLVGCKRESVYHWLPKGVLKQIKLEHKANKPVQRRRRSMSRANSYVFCIQRGESVASIAARENISHQRVYQILSEAGYSSKQIDAPAAVASKVLPCGTQIGEFVVLTKPFRHGDDNAIVVRASCDSGHEKYISVSTHDRVIGRCNECLKDRTRARWAKCVPIGARFVDWTVLSEPSLSTGTLPAVWRVKCVCKCGREKEVRCQYLTAGSSTGCGCARAENMNRKKAAR